MTWPTTTTSTTNIDADTDSIAEARFEIFKNVKDVNSIIDEFNISTPTANDILSYNSSTNKFVNITPANSFVGLFSFSNFSSTTGTTFEYFQGTFTKDYGSDLGITSTTDSDGDLVVTFPAGIYVVTIEEGIPAPTGSISGGGDTQGFSIRWKDESDSVIANLTKSRQDFSTYFYDHNTAKLDFTSDTDVKFDYYNYDSANSNATVSYPQLTIRRI